MTDSTLESSTSENSSSSKFTWARAFRDIGVSAINTGQFPFFCMFVVVLTILLKMPPDDISKMVFEILNNIRTFAVSGYILFAISLVLGFFYFKAVRKSHKKQICKRDELIEKLKEDLKGKLSLPMVGEVK